MTFTVNGDVNCTRYSIRAWNTAAQTLTSVQELALSFATYTQSNFSFAGGSTFTIPLTGLYYVTYKVTIMSSFTNTTPDPNYYVNTAIKVNGAYYGRVCVIPVCVAEHGNTGAAIISPLAGMNLSIVATIDVNGKTVGDGSVLRQAEVNINYLCPA